MKYLWVDRNTKLAIELQNYSIIENYVFRNENTSRLAHGP